MKWSLAIALALALGIGVTGSRNAVAQAGLQCNNFLRLRNDAQQKAAAIGAAEKRKADRKVICTLVTRFSTAEATVVKFLQENEAWCGIPPQAVNAAKANHEKTLKFRKVVCTEAPRPRVPTLSEAIGGPSIDTRNNTKTGRGTFDSLVGNPLAR
jgi:hypothetical protein